MPAAEAVLHRRVVRLGANGVDGDAAQDMQREPSLREDVIAQSGDAARAFHCATDLLAGDHAVELRAEEVEAERSAQCWDPNVSEIGLEGRGMTPVLGGGGPPRGPPSRRSRGTSVRPTHVG